jgi:hydrogenase nickel incorporation protein HypB
MDKVKLIEVKEDILSDNTKLAEAIRDDLRKKGTLLLNIMSSPGSGKTSLILRTIKEIKNSIRIGVIEADIDSIVDAEKIMATGISAVQLRTGGFCHLDAAMVAKGLQEIPLGELDLVFIENIGNLVCPAEFDTGAHINVMILSVPEGDDKPLKYPLMFSTCDLLLVNKVDYLPFSDFDMGLFRERVLQLNSDIIILEISAKTGAGIEAWIYWLNSETEKFKKHGA